MENQKDLVKSILLQVAPQLTDAQFNQLLALIPLYQSWNEKINLISRKDMDHFVVHHLLHCISLSKFVHWPAGIKVLDLGTGGGFPAIPLAICFPQVKFTAIDGTGKKILVVNDIIKNLNLPNITALHQRAEDHFGSYTFVVSRAVASIDKLISWSRPLISRTQKSSIPNGLYCYKGGNLHGELQLLQKDSYHELYQLSDILPQEYFLNKKIVYVQI